MIKKPRGPGAIFGQTYGNGIWPAGYRKGRGRLSLSGGVGVIQKGLGLLFDQRLTRFANPPRSPASSQSFNALSLFGSGNSSKGFHDQGD